MKLGKILCVDDQEIVHRMYQTVLARFRESGTVILQARNGWEAMMTLADNPDTDLILLDINMPVMNGLAFLDQRKKTPFANIPVVIVSAEGSRPDEVALALALGAAACLPKPFDTAAIEKVVESVFGE